MKRVIVRSRKRVVVEVLRISLISRLILIEVILTLHLFQLVEKPREQPGSGYKDFFSCHQPNKMAKQKPVALAEGDRRRSKRTGGY
jgi:hypothetical protein